MAGERSRASEGWRGAEKEKVIIKYMTAYSITTVTQDWTLKPGNVIFNM